MNKNRTILFVRIHLAICIILTSSVIFWGCSSVQSVRQSPYKLLSRTKKETDKGTNKNTVISPSTDINRNETIPTETKPLNHISDNRLSYQNEVSELYEQVIELKKEIALLRESISYLEDKLESKHENLTYTVTGDIPNYSHFEEDQSKKSQPTNKMEKGKSFKKVSKKLRNEKLLSVENTKKTKTRNSQPSQNVDEEKEFLENINTVLNQIKEKKYDIALNNLERLEQTTSDAIKQSTINYWKGEIFFLQKQYSSALDYFLKVQNIQRAPKEDKALLMIAECYARLGKIEKAKKTYEKFIENFPFSEYISRAKKMIQQL